MEALKIFLIIVLPLVILGCIAGIILGKYQLKKANRQLRRLLSRRQRVVCSASVAAGVVCVLLGVLLPNPAPQYPDMNGDVIFADGMGMAEGEDMHFDDGYAGSYEEEKADGDTAYDDAAPPAGGAITVTPARPPRAIS